MSDITGPIDKDGVALFLDEESGTERLDGWKIVVHKKRASRQSERCKFVVAVIIVLQYGDEF
jgi:hypothetical protein